jgi:hypothetical protein
MTSRIPVLLLATASLACAPTGLAAQSALPRAHTPEPTGADITSGDLMTRLYIFADDSMMGRETGTLGNVKGTAYIAAELKRIGLEPAGDDGTYFQTVPYKTRAVDTLSLIAVNGERLRLGDDFLPAGRAPAKVTGVTAVYGGSAADTEPGLSPEQARGKLVVLAAGQGSLTRRARRLTFPGAAAIAVVGLEEVPPPFRQYFLRPQGFVDDPAASETPDGDTPIVIVSREAAAKMFSAPLAELEPGVTGTTVDVDLRYDVQDLPYPSRNVVGIIPGSDPALRGEYVAIGAHNDHVGMTDTPVAHDSLRIWNRVVRPEGADSRVSQATPEQQAEVNRLLAAYRAAHPGAVLMDSISNGADDDGSGSVAVLEIAEKIAAMSPRPKRSILFVWHVGEEKGLLGSRWFTDHPTVPRDSIVAQLNLDMVGRGGADDETGRTIDGAPLHGGPNYLMLVGSRRLSSELGNLVERVNVDNGHDMTFDYAFDAENHPSNIYGRSDHYEYARFGIPIVFFTTGLHSDYHQVTDEPAYIDYEHMAKVARLVEDVAIHVADLDHRVSVDHPITDGNDGGEE